MKQRLDLSFNDGRHFSLPAELLRVCSPSADNQRPGRVSEGDFVLTSLTSSALNMNYFRFDLLAILRIPY